MKQPTDWRKGRAPAEGTMQPTRTTGPKGPMARGKTNVVGRTRSEPEWGGGGCNLAVHNKGVKPGKSGK